MSDGVRMSWDLGAALAGTMIKQLQPACKRIAVGGSLRRGSVDVGDLELIAISDGEALYQAVDEWLYKGIVEKRLKSNGSPIAWARRYRAMLFQGVPVDLFVTCPSQWGLIHVLRTGPGKPESYWKGGANQYLVTQRRQGGLLPNDLRMADGWIWRGEKRLLTPEESDVYQLLGIPFIAPYYRSVQTYRAWQNEGPSGVERLRESQWHPALNRTGKEKYWPSVGWGGDSAFCSWGRYFRPYTNEMLIRLAERWPIAGKNDGMIGRTHVHAGAVAAAAN
jgi:hypothetical protein